MSNCKNKEGGTHHFACDCRETRFKKLEAELKAMDEARLSAAAVIVGYQEKFSKQEAKLKAAREEIVQLKSFDWQNAMIDLTAERDRLREALVGCIGWMEPVMDGFGVPKDSGAYKVLTNAKAALTEEKRK